MVDRKNTALIAGIFILGIVLRTIFLWSQPPLEDDYLFVVSAENYMQRGQIGPSMIHHPNLRNILIYISTRLIGKGPLGVYGPSLITGVLSILLVYLLCLEWTGERLVSLIAMFFLAVDPLHISFSRQAIQETTTAFFILLGVYLFFVFLRNNRDLFLALSGISFGLGTASKWQALFPLFYCLVYLIATRKKESLRHISYLTILPFTVYLLTFLPWFLRGYDLLEWLHYQRQLFFLNTLLVNPIEEVIKNPGKPLLWFIIPSGYGIFTYSESTPYVMIALGNPLTWLIAIPALAYILICSERKRYLHIAGVFLVSYIPMIMASINRDIYVLSAVSVIPFAFMAVAAMVGKLAGRIKFFLSAYLSLVFVVSLLMIPLSTGKALEYPYLKGIVEQYNPHKNGESPHF